MSSSQRKTLFACAALAGAVFAAATPTQATQYWSTCFHGKYHTEVFWSNSERRKIMEAELTKLLPELAAAPHFNYPTCSMQESREKAEEHRSILMKNWGPEATNVPLPFPGGPDTRKQQR